MSKDLNPEKALIFRIMHKDNISQVLSDGCHCANKASGKKYVVIGNQELIDRRKHRDVPCDPGGTLSDYVPFYFTPYTPMLYNIITGYNGFPKKPKDEIVILVSSLHLLKEKQIKFVFTDRHAYLRTAQFSNDLADLNRITWTTLQQRDFRKDDLDKFEKYQAEALIYQHMPLAALKGIVCYNDSEKAAVQTEAAAKKASIKIIAQPKWYL
jgi:ssDNA thymidine ADP-ribosyltransferase, DarT